MRRGTWIACLASLAAVAVAGQFALASRRPSKTPAVASGVFAALGGLRSIAAEILWFRADRLQDEGRYVEMAQLASALAFMEPHTPEIWSYAAWNLAYNISIMMPTLEDRWRWVEAAIRLLRDEGLKYNPDSRELCRELAWMFELKIGVNIDEAASIYRSKWRKVIEDVRSRGAWGELGMDETQMRRIESMTGFDDWTNPQLSAIYWGLRGGCADIVSQASAIYRKTRETPKAD